jgi:hypothetical protein
VYEKEENHKQNSRHDKKLIKPTVLLK